MTICYFGIFDPKFSRNAVYIKGLREHGVEVLLCTDTAPGLRKYVNIIRKFWEIRKSIDVIIVGYSGYIIVPIAKLMSLVTIRKPVVFDAVCSFYEGNILSRDAFRRLPFRVFYARCVDFLANMSADFLLLETEAQKKYYVRRLGIPAYKCIVALTGVNDDFYYDPVVKKLPVFTVLFRGKFTPEAGLKHVLDAANILSKRDPSIHFRIIGFGWGKVNDEIQNQVKRLNLANLEFINTFLPMDELRRKVLECHVSLGQFEDHERLERTIPHKAFEALAMKIPYVTARTLPSQELFEEGETCLFVNQADAADVADKLVELKNNPSLLQSLADNGYKLYEERLTSAALARTLLTNLHAQGAISSSTS